MKRTTEQRLRNALAAADLIAEAVAGRTFTDDAADVWLRSGVERQLEIVGEALNSARRASPEAAARVPRVNEWDTAGHDIPELRKRLGLVLASGVGDTVS